MKFYIDMCNYASKSPYSYIVIHADEPLTKFHVWGKTKGFNTLCYDEKKVFEMMQEKYPDAERIEKKLKYHSKNRLISK